MNTFLTATTAIFLLSLGVVDASSGPKPTPHPTPRPTPHPTRFPTAMPSAHPSAYPSEEPSSEPSENPSVSPSAHPTEKPSSPPSAFPSASPSASPSEQPSVSPSVQPSLSIAPSVCPKEETVLLEKTQAFHTTMLKTVFPPNIYVQQQHNSNLVIYSGQPNDNENCVIWESGNLDHVGAYYTRLDETGNICTRPGGTDPATTPCLWKSGSSGRKTKSFSWDATVAEFYFGVGTSFTYFGDCKLHVYIMKGTPENPLGPLWSEPIYPECGQKPWIPAPTYIHVPAPVPAPVPAIAPIKHGVEGPVTVLMKSKDAIAVKDGPLHFSPAGVSLVQKADGNFILYRGSTEAWLWESGYISSHGVGPHYTMLQKDGNLITRPGIDTGSPRVHSVWKTQSKGDDDDYYLVLSFDQKTLSIRQGSVHGTIVWMVYTR